MLAQIRKTVRVAFYVAGVMAAVYLVGVMLGYGLDRSGWRPVQIAVEVCD